jgi:2-dehydropantoate 2-reductase
MSVMGEDEIRQAAVILLKEVWAIARAEGAQLEDDKAELIVGGSAKRQAGGTSMYYDTMAGRPTEHDAIHGAALRKAAEHGIAVPAVTLMHALLEHRA